jgi:hypothetical protein
MMVEVLVVGVLLQSVGLGLGAQRWAFQRSARKLRGRVVERRITRRSGTMLHAPTIEFSVGEQLHRYESGMFGTGCPELGAEVELLVHPDDAGIVVIRGWSGGSTAAVVLLVIGTVLSIAGLFAEPS